jgi:hypothetical protein
MISAAQKDSFHEILTILFKHGVLEHLILIGSWSEYVYEASGILGAFEANLRTRDYDFFVPNAARPSPPVNLKKILSSHGWNAMDDQMTGATKFLKTTDTLDVFEVEFLVGMRGKGREFIFPVKSLAIKGQSLRELNMLDEEPLAVKYGKWLLRVPNPVQYVLHKILINPSRITEEKQLKDIQAVRNLLDNMRTSEWRSRLRKAYENLTKKQKKVIQEVAAAQSLYLGFELD